MTIDEYKEEYLGNLKTDPNKWRAFREFMSALGLWESDQDYIEGFVGEMIKELELSKEK